MHINDFKKGQVLLVDKPREFSSFDVIRILRRKLRGVKMGHAGTLDPLATGLLIICSGKKTKEIEKYQGMEKEYVGTMFIGASTPSYDMETKVDQEFPIGHINSALIHETIKQFTGSIEQRPPQHSAVKVGGKRAYKLARQGEVIVMPPRQVEVRSFEILNEDLKSLSFRISCTKGTYIRSLAHDFGKALGSGAYLSSLRRTAIGSFRVENAKTPDQWLEELSTLNVDEIND